MPIKAVLIDHDGTLVDSEICHFQMWVDVLKTYGVSPGEAAYKNHYAGLPTPENAPSINCLAVPTPMSEKHDFGNAFQSFSNITQAADWIIAQA